MVILLFQISHSNPASHLNSELLKLKGDFISMWQRTWCAREVLYHLHHSINYFLNQLGYLLLILIVILI